MDFYVPSRQLRDWIDLAACAVGVPASPGNDLARELRDLLEDHGVLNDGYERLADCLAQRGLEPVDGVAQDVWVEELLGTLAATRDHLTPHGFDLITGDLEDDDGENVTGPSRLAKFLADHDDLVRFRHRVAEVLEDCGAIQGEIDDNRMVNLLRMLMPG